MHIYIYTFKEYHKKFVSVFTGENSAQCHEGRANYSGIEAIKQTTFFVVTQSFTLSSDLQTTKSSTQFVRIYTFLYKYSLRRTSFEINQVMFVLMVALGD